jgi:hypothetical protein
VIEAACWKCGADLGAVPQPFGRRAECPACHAELHVCRMCRHYAPSKAKQCMEPMAEEVKDKVRANFCEWFQPAAKRASAPAAGDDRKALDDLFGGGAEASPAAPDEARKALDDLFGG